MYEKPQLGLAQVQASMAAMLKEAAKEPNRPLAIAIAIADDEGKLIAFVRMDNCPPVPQKAAIKRLMLQPATEGIPGALAERLKAQGESVAEYGDPELTAGQGGVVIVRSSDGTIMGGIGVSGLLAPEDEDIARIDLNVLNL